MENLQELDCYAFRSDQSLLLDLFQFPRRKPLGLLLLPDMNDCALCGSKLLLRKDRPAPVVVYDDSMGTIPASHYHKVCTNRACGCIQYYGYYTAKADDESTSRVIFNDG